jgi:hypothetical protein
MARRKNATELAEKLFRDGYFIVDGVFPNLRAELEEAFQGFQEFKQHPTFDELHKDNLEQKYICGGTAFLSNPSIFHNMASQRFRTRTTSYLMPILTRFIPMLGNPDYKLARYLDRIQVRPKGDAAAAEAWHRDAPPKTHKGEFWLGGFHNCDPTNIKFCCIKGSHQLDSASKGFEAVKDSEKPELNRRLLAQANQEDTDEKGNIVVPPGYVIMWISTIIHQIYSIPAKKTSVKHFLGYRITPYNSTGVYKTVKEEEEEDEMCSTKKKKKKEKKIVEVSHEIPMHELQQQMHDNAVMVLPSGQPPAMYPGLYLCNQEQLKKRYLTMVRSMFLHSEDDMRYRLFGRDGKMIRNADGKLAHQGGHFTDTRSMKSLKEILGHAVYPYNETEINLVRPQKDIRIWNFDKNKEEVFSIMYPDAKYKTPDVDFAIPDPINHAKSESSDSPTRKRKQRTPSTSPSSKRKKTTTPVHRVTFRKSAFKLCRTNHM